MTYAFRSRRAGYIRTAVHRILYIASKPDRAHCSRQHPLSRPRAAQCAKHAYACAASIKDRYYTRSCRRAPDLFIIVLLFYTGLSWALMAMAWPWPAAAMHKAQPSRGSRGGRSPVRTPKPDTTRRNCVTQGGLHFYRGHDRTIINVSLL